jgi:hypothetical protein
MSIAWQNQETSLMLERVPLLTRAHTGDLKATASRARRLCLVALPVGQSCPSEKHTRITFFF